MAQSDIIWYSQTNIYGQKFKCSRRTAAHIDKTRYRLRKLGEKRKKTYTLRIIQGSFNTSVSASAGTHDYDACLDVQIIGMDWYEAQKFLRRQGWAAWVRTPAQGFSWHIHMISLPKYKKRFVARVGEWVPGQIDAYYAHNDGLAGGGSPDNTWHPKSIINSIFRYNLWLAEVAARKSVKNLSKRLRDARRKLKRIRNR